MILHVHKDQTDELDLIQVANEFVKNNDTRKQHFGCFDEIDRRARDVPVKSKYTQTKTVRNTGTDA